MVMKKIAPILILILLIACTAGPSVQVGDTKVNVELAITAEEKAKGLMHREYLDENAGVLFVFEKEGIPGFWMKNTLISLDMIFIDSDNKIVDIMTVEPCKKEPCKRYSPKTDSKYVLEVNAGFAEKHNLQIGEEVKLNI